MPICIECRYPVPQLYHVLHSSNKRGTSAKPSAKTAENGIQRSSAGGTKNKPAGGTAGGDVRLTQCPRCKRFADKYVEHDFVVLFIDLVLVKPQVSICGVDVVLISGRVNKEERHVSADRPKKNAFLRSQLLLRTQKLMSNPRFTAIFSSTASVVQTTSLT